MYGIFKSNQLVFNHSIAIKTLLSIANMSESIESMLIRFKGMSWADINYLLEEEEEEALALEKTNTLRELDAQRRELFAKGHYELEEGEIFE